MSSATHLLYKLNDRGYQNFMIETYLFRIETDENNYHHTIYSVDIKAAVGKWVSRIEDWQNQVYSFNSEQVQNIKQQHSSGLLRTQLDKEPFFLTYQTGEKYQVVNIEKLNKGLPDFIAKVSYLSTEQGGRKGYAASGYRPHVKFDGKKELTSGEQLFIDKDKVFPGETVTAEIRILGKDCFQNYLFVGQHFEVAEGPRLVAHGEVLEVINPNLYKADQIFFITSMPPSRPADYYLGYMDGCVFLDFNKDENGRVALIRISFDGYGCCRLENHSIPLNEDDSVSFLNIIQDNIIDQEALNKLVKTAIQLNKESIWLDALEEYHLI